MFDKRRHFPRILLDDLCRDDAILSGSDVIKNISGGGCFIETQKELSVGDMYQITLTLLEDEEPIIRRGIIVWEYNGPHEEDSERMIRGYGIKFIDDSRRSASEILNGITRYRKKQGLTMFRFSKIIPEE